MRKCMMAASLAVLAPLAGAATPEPAIAPVSWELNFKYQDPQKVAVKLPGDKEPAAYWYMLYSVENPSDREVEFYPRFEIVTDRLEVITHEIRVSPEAFKAVQRRSGDPLLLPPEQVIGKILRGKDRARRSVAIWRDMDPKTRSFTVYVSGLSGETKRVKNPVFDPEKPENDKNRRYFVLRKTLAIPYRLPGGDSARDTAQPERVLGEEKWIMR